MQSLINFRDFGGWTTSSGASVARDRLFRSGHLAHIKPPALKHVLGLDYQAIADLRYLSERKREPSPWPDAYASRVLTHGGEQTTEAPHMQMLRTGSLTCEGVDHFYLNLYQSLPFDPLYRPLFARSFVELAQIDGRLLVHCAAGKDRTGILSALILDVLGVSREDILIDYMRSAGAPGLMAIKPKLMRRAQKQYGHVLQDDAVDALLGVKPEYIARSFKRIEEEEGSVAAYLERSGVRHDTQNRVRARLLTE